MWTEEILNARILVVDDEPANVRLIERVLEKLGYDNARGVTDARDVMDLIDAFDPDIVLLDLHMPHVDGFQILADLRQKKSSEYLPVLVLTADVNPETRLRALREGANDFLTKPVEPTEVGLRVRHLLATRFMTLELQDQTELLEQKIRARTFDLEEAQIEIMERLARAAEYRDDDTGQHTFRVGHNAAELAKVAGMSPPEVELIRTAAPLHDVGKIGIPDSILLKPGPLTDEEFAIMKPHTVIGAKILSGSRFRVLQLAEQIAMSHHEAWNGSGYPHGIAGDRIPIAARIVALADTFDAITHARPYKEAWPVEKALDIIREGIGKRFDPDLAQLFIEYRRTRPAELDEKMRRAVRRRSA
ncbi:MAG TPA: HD domain-containing phosphohydrolase [Longimicrobiales bacterium]